MKYLLLGLLLSFPALGFNQEKDCQRFKDGNFIIRDKRNGAIYLKRKGNLQIETAERDKVKLKFKVVWLDECTYTLTLTKIARNPQKIPFDKSMILTVQILETKKNSYIQRSTSNKSETEYESEIFIME